MNFDQHRAVIVQKFQQIANHTNDNLDEYLLDLFHFQYKYNVVYRQYCNNLGVKTFNIAKITDIPFLPISAFKFHEVKTGEFAAQEIFMSSGTTGALRSIHHVRDISLYLENTIKIWSLYFNPVNEYCFLALLPGYLERDGSSLIHMVDRFIKCSTYDISGFYLRNHQELYEKLVHCKQQNIKTVLIGVSYALLDFIAAFHIDFPDLTVIETGGMKGQRKEITKAELHAELSCGFKVENIFSEYGMTELLSQAYSMGGGSFGANKYLRIFTKQTNDVLTHEKQGKPGIISVIDAANIDSCAFIQTEDMGICHLDGSFEILGRVDSADIRGCNLMLQEL